MEVQLTEVQSGLIESIARKEGFTDFEVGTEPAAGRGDNYMGAITTVSVRNDQKRLDLILKSASKNEELRKKVCIRELYLTEIHLYGNILSEFDKFQKEEGLENGFSAYPKIYGSLSEDLNECLVLENLKAAGYKLWNRKVPMNSDHVALVLFEYGKLHAASLAMKEKKPELYQKLTKNVFEYNVSEEDQERTLSSIIKNGLDAARGNQIATEALERFSLDAKKFLLEDIKFPEDRIVVTHGDCWCNNLMFKYEDPQNIKRPTKVRLLDWQISSTGSPAMDLGMFLIICSPKEILLDSRRYLKIYHDSVRKNLMELSCDPEGVFPFTLLEYHWKKYAKYGLYMALMFLKLVLSEADEVPDMGEIAESGQNLADGLIFDSVNNSNYSQRITDILIAMAETGLI